MNRFRHITAPLSALAIVLVLAACGGSSAKTGGSSTRIVTVRSSTPQASTSGSSLQQSFLSVIDHVSPEVVQISNPQGLGSGIVFDSKGDIVTNDHVIAGGGPLRVTDSHGRTYPATLVGAFPEDDIAVVQAQGASLPEAQFANARSLRVGDIVLALGNPLGLRSSATNGIVSAVGRTVGEPNGVVLPDVIQTSAPINPGNSGGALVNLEGQVVGIPTLAATDPQLGGGAAPGIGFAIPSSIVTDIAGQILQHGHVVDSHRAYLGVRLAAGLSSGAVVVAVQSGGPAAKAKIAPGEVISSIDGQAVSAPIDVAQLLAAHEPGQTVSVGLVKPDGSRAVVKVKLSQYPGTA